MLILRPMTEKDLPAVEAWLRLPHVASWWTPDYPAEAAAMGADDGEIGRRCSLAAG
jgi:hypothetical protein